MGFKVTYKPGVSGTTPEAEVIAASDVQVGDVWITFSQFAGANEYRIITLVRVEDVKRIDQQ